MYLWQCWIESNYTLIKNEIHHQEMEVSDNPTLRRDTSDPTLICTAYKKNRFYMFTRREPEDTKG